MTERQDIRLREVRPADLDIFFEQQQEPEATEIAAFPARDRNTHFEHWNKILRDETVITRTVVVDKGVAGNVVSWVQDGRREIGYWIGKRFWGRGIATGALRDFLLVVEDRPLFAWVARHNAGSIRVLEKVGFVFDRDDGNHRVYKIG